MQKEKLKQYVKDVYILESQYYIYQQISRIYEKQLRRLNREKNTIYYKDGVDYSKRGHGRRNFVIPSPEAKPTYLGERKNLEGRERSVFGFRGIRDMFRDIPERWWDESLRKLEKEEHDRFKRIHLLILVIAVVMGTAISMLIRNVLPFILVIAVGILACYFVGNEHNKEYLPGDFYYEKFMHVYQKHYEKELEEKHALFSPMIELIENEYEKLVVPNRIKTEEKLKKLYKKNLIEPEYRNFMAVTQIYDYLNSGRCSKLEGSDGAYQLYDKELAEGILIPDLEISVFQLEKYSSIMSTMVSLLKYKDQVANDIITQMKEMQPNAALKAFIKKCDEKITLRPYEAVMLYKKN